MKNQSNCCEKCRRSRANGNSTEIGCRWSGCPCHKSAEKQCNCAHFQTQIVNATEGSYTNRFDWQCPIHGTMHKEFDTPEGFAPAAEKDVLGDLFDAVNGVPTTSKAEKDTYTCEHGVVQPIGTHSHAPVGDTVAKLCCSHCNRYPANVEQWKMCTNHRCDCHKRTTDTGDWRERFKSKEVISSRISKEQMDTLEAFIEKEIEKARQIEHCDQPACPECDKAAYERGKAEGRAEEAADCYKHQPKVAIEYAARQFEAGLKKGREEGYIEERDDEHVLDIEGRKGFEAGRASATKEFQSKIWKNDEAYKMGRTSAFAEVKEMIGGMRIDPLSVKEAKTRELKATVDSMGAYNAALSSLLTKLTDKQV